MAINYWCYIMLLQIALGLATGFILAYILGELLYRLRRRRESPVVRRMRNMIEGRRVTELRAGYTPRLNIESLLLLIDNWVVPLRLIGEDQASLLKNLGLVKILEDVVAADKHAMRRLVDGLRDRHFEPPHQIIDLPEEILMELGKRGILSVTFFEVSSEVGPRFLFATTKTRTTVRLYSDTELQNRLFLLTDRLNEFQIDERKLIFRGIRGGERGLEGFVVAEVVIDVDTEAIIRLLSRITSLPRSAEEAIDIFRNIFR